ncbi:MAG: hypothetical protein K2K67_09065 [Treponemataceae bacterium]|nr:hypothetical protein [Treponemataceae bacterium]
MMEIEMLPEDLKLTEKKVEFFRADGSRVAGKVGMCGEDKDGNVCFYEVVSDKIVRGKIESKEKFCRICIRRVFPYVAGDDVDERA